MKRLFVRLYLFLLVCLFVILAGTDPFVRQLIKDENEAAYKELARGTFFLLSQELSGLDEARMREKLDELQPEFSYPLTLYPISALRFDQQDHTDLQEGSLVFGNISDRHYMRLENSDFVLATGPFPIEVIFYRARLIFWALVIVVMIFPAGLWAFFMERNLTKIEKTSEKFVTGDHSARLSLPRLLPLQKIVSAFNYMAEGTQKLINSQKDLVNSVSHEIRTPLARIKFSLEMLQGSIGPQSSQHKDYVQEIGKDVEEINSLVDEMLTYARFERKRESVEVLDKNEMISWLREMIAKEQKNCGDKRLALTVEPETKRLISRYEPVYLARALKNIIQNAVKYTHTKIEVILETGLDFYCIHVDDDGPGIPGSDREKIFEPFSRLDTSRHKSSGGYGLGLAIAERIILWHNGTIHVETSPMGGARFTITLPFLS